MIAVVDYQMGNLRSVSKAIEAAGGSVTVTSDPDLVARADKVVLPGVGACGKAMENLAARGLDDAVKTAVSSGKQFLGICLGLQLLFETSFEDGEHQGLGIFPGSVVRFEPNPAAHEMKIPHIGWNRVEVTLPAPHLDGIKSGTYFYFVHSYYVAPDDDHLTACRTDYLCRFTSAVWRDNVFACQFHPEKSQAWGLKLLENFVNL